MHYSTSRHDKNYVFIHIYVDRHGSSNFEFKLHLTDKILVEKIKLLLKSLTCLFLMLRIKGWEEKREEKKEEKKIKMISTLNSWNVGKKRNWKRAYNIIHISRIRHNIMIFHK